MKNQDKKSSFENVLASIKAGESFILEAGAGSGKTFTLIQTLNTILENEFDNLQSRGQKISCITFTNVAKDEIIERTQNNSLIEVLTIHEFLWDCIKNYQKELHIKLEEINKEYERQRTEEKRRKTYVYIQDLLTLIKDIPVEYTEYGRNFKEGKLTHEDVILISYFMFRDYPVLSEIIADRFPYIFVDEYQDTEPETVSVLVEHILKSKKKSIVGFFGDSMQKIYDDGIGEIDKKYFLKDSKEKCLNFITKEENYRCSISVIDLLNKIRKNIQQTPGSNNLQGSISFYKGSSFENNLIELQAKYNWDFNQKNTKILFLTHSGIGNKLGYEGLLTILGERYGQYGRDRFFKKDERFSKFLLGENGVEVLLENYEHKNYGEVIELLKSVRFQILSHKDKEEINEKIEELKSVRGNGTVLDVVECIKKNKLLAIPDKILDFEIYLNRTDLSEEEKEKHEKDKSYYASLMKLNYNEIISAYRFIEDKTIYSTKHGVKGAEFDNVLVVLDGSWPQKFNFQEVFENKPGNKNRIDRSTNLFYVCCSRAKNNLGILSITSFSADAFKTIQEWFGAKNIFQLTN